MELSAAIHALFSSGGRGSRAPVAELPALDVDALCAEVPALRADVWQSCVDHTDEAVLTSKNARRVAGEAVYAMQLMPCVVQRAEAEASSPDAPELVAAYEHGTRLAWMLAALVNTLAGKLEAADATQATDLTVSLVPALTMPVDARLDYESWPAAPAGGDTDAGFTSAVRVISRAEEVAAMVGASCRWLTASSETALRYARRGGLCPFTALVNACLRAFVINATSAAQLKKLHALLLTDERQSGAPRCDATAGAETLLAAILHAHDSVSRSAASDSESELRGQFADCGARALRALRTVLFTDAFVAGLSGAFARSLTLAQHGALTALRQAAHADTAVGVADAPAALRDYVLSAKYPTVSSSAMIMPMVHISSERKLFQLLNDAIAASMGAAPDASGCFLLRAVPILCNMYLDAALALENAEGGYDDVSDRKRATDATAAAPPSADAAKAGDDTVHPLAAAVVKQLVHRSRFLAVLEFMCVLLGYSIPSDAVRVNTETSPVSQFAVLTRALHSAPRVVAPMLEAAAGLLRLAADNSVYNLHEDVSPHAHFSALWFIVDALLHVAREAPTSMTNDEALVSAKARQACIIASLQLNSALVLDLPAALYAVVQHSSRARESEAMLLPLLLQVVEQFSRLRQLHVAMSALRSLWLACIKSGSGAEERALHGACTSAEFISSLSRALRTLPPGQISDMDKLVTCLLVDVTTEVDATRSRVPAARATPGSKRRRDASAADSAVVAPTTCNVGFGAIDACASISSVFLRCLWLTPSSAPRVLARAVHMALGPGEKLLRLLHSVRTGGGDTGAAITAGEAQVLSAVCSLISAATDAVIAAMPHAAVREFNIRLHDSPLEAIMHPMWPMEAFRTAPGVEAPASLDSEAHRYYSQDVALAFQSVAERARSTPAEDRRTEMLPLVMFAEGRLRLARAFHRSAASSTSACVAPYIALLRAAGADACMRALDVLSELGSSEIFDDIADACLDHTLEAGNGAARGSASSVLYDSALLDLTTAVTAVQRRLVARCRSALQCCSTSAARTSSTPATASKRKRAADAPRSAKKDERGDLDPWVDAGIASPHGLVHSICTASRESGLCVIPRPADAGRRSLMQIAELFDLLPKGMVLASTRDETTSMSVEIWHLAIAAWNSLAGCDDDADVQCARAKLARFIGVASPHVPVSASVPEELLTVLMSKLAEADAAESEVMMLVGCSGVFFSACKDDAAVQASISSLLDVVSPEKHRGCTLGALYDGLALAHDRRRHAARPFGTYLLHDLTRRSLSDAKSFPAGAQAAMLARALRAVVMSAPGDGAKQEKDVKHVCKPLRADLVHLTTHSDDPRSAVMVDALRRIAEAMTAAAALAASDAIEMCSAKLLDAFLPAALTTMARGGVSDEGLHSAQQSVQSCVPYMRLSDIESSAECLSSMVSSRALDHQMLRAAAAFTRGIVRGVATTAYATSAARGARPIDDSGSESDSSDDSDTSSSSSASSARGGGAGPYDGSCIASQAHAVHIRTALRKLVAVAFNLLTAAASTQPAGVDLCFHALRDLASRPKVARLSQAQLHALVTVCISAPRTAAQLEAAAAMLQAVLKYYRTPATHLLPGIVGFVNAQLRALVTFARTDGVGGAASTRASDLNTGVCRLLQALALVIRPTRYHAVHLLASVFEAASVYVRNSSDAVRTGAEVNERLRDLRTGLFAILDACQSRELQEIHVRLSGVTARNLFKDFHKLYDAEFKYTGKA